MGHIFLGIFYMMILDPVTFAELFWVDGVLTPTDAWQLKPTIQKYRKQQQENLLASVTKDM